MTEALVDYGLFLAKTLTIVAAIGFVVALLVTASKKSREPEGLQVKDLGRKLRDGADALRRSLMPGKDWKTYAKRLKRERKAKKDEDRPRLFVVDFRGDIRASASSSLREEINAILAVVRPEDEVLLRLENYGGLVHEHGLAASQLVRLRERSVRLTVAVDKVAASGGYLMACVANRIVAAPFAIVGSIGVLAQIPNFRRLLDERGVTVEQVKAGRFKRTVTMFGEVTDADRAKLKEEIEDIHTLFQQMVATHRPELDLEKVATGEYWHGTRALELGLVDELSTSDELLTRAVEKFDVYAVKWSGKKKLADKMASAVESGMSRAIDAALERARSGW